MSKPHRPAKKSLTYYRVLNPETLRACLQPKAEPRFAEFERFHRDKGAFATVQSSQCPLAMPTASKEPKFQINSDGQMSLQLPAIPPHDYERPTHRHPK